MSEPSTHVINLELHNRNLLREERTSQAVVVRITVHLGEYSSADKIVVVGCEHGAHGQDTSISAIAGQLKSAFYPRFVDGEKRC